ncbi:MULTISPECIES: spore protease YyaC [Bacillaceae]|jgi:putative sporulation protein YyaC|uniref:spore protease YyaC n=1 Tax=Bacillaceae TaxID=186817 RepID=UPI0006FCBAFE|nr:MULTISPECIES: spore protease YyaC [Bacillaceae]KQL34739.1 sporulation protein [Psychrobacillus sp. FJAT-21963]MDF2067502.1 spore protease YyaC [Bacillus sp. Cr_A10]
MNFQAAEIKESSTINYKETGVVWKLSNFFLDQIPFDHPNLVFCCIGTDRSTGDALGPMTGSFLTQLSSFPFQIVGTLDNPLHALNIEEITQELLDSPSKPFIIAIDACLGNSGNIGQIIVHPGPLYPGKAVKKELPPIGEISIKAVVNIGGFMEYNVLQSTRLNITFEMGKVISRALLLAWHRYNLKIINKSNSNRNYN